MYRVAGCSEPRVCSPALRTPSAASTHPAGLGPHGSPRLWGTCELTHPCRGRTPGPLSGRSQSWRPVGNSAAAPGGRGDSGRTVPGGALGTQRDRALPPGGSPARRRERTGLSAPLKPQNRTASCWSCGGHSPLSPWGCRAPRDPRTFLAPGSRSTVSGTRRAPTPAESVRNLGNRPTSSLLMGSYWASWGPRRRPHQRCARARPGGRRTADRLSRFNRSTGFGKSMRLPCPAAQTWEEAAKLRPCQSHRVGGQ